MADKSKIEWCDATWNVVRGCSVVSDGCKNCYAMQVAARFSGEGMPYEGLAYRNSSGAHWTGKVRLIEKHLEDPLRWKRPRRIFVNSMSDLFHPSVTFDDQLSIFHVMRTAHWHTYQALTKRADIMLERVPKILAKLNISEPPPQIWLGVSVEDQKTADARIPLLLQTPAAVQWISAEPLLGPIDASLYLYPAMNKTLGKGMYPVKGLDWVVVGGESGHGARPMHPDWARSLRDQCVAAGVPFFFKQWGAFTQVKRGACPHLSSDGAQGPVVNLNPQRVDVWRCGICNALHDGDFDFALVGKKAAGRILDGRTWDEYP